MLASDLQPLGHLKLLSEWDVVHADELEIVSPVLFPVAHAQSERESELIPADTENL